MRYCSCHSNIKFISSRKRVGNLVKTKNRISYLSFKSKRDICGNTSVWFLTNTNLTALSEFNDCLLAVNFANN